MAWLQKRTDSTSRAALYSTSLGKTILLVGLGNPGKEYDDTRHNIGFHALEDWVSKTDEMGDWVAKKDLECQEASGRLGDTRVIAIKPQTFMNLSGNAVQKVAAFYKVPASQICVLHDELDIDFGQIRLRVGGASAGHNGVKSITQMLGTEDYGRIRIGIGPKDPPQIDSADFVLQKFKAAQAADMPALLRETNAILSEYVYGGQLPTDTRSFIL